MSAKHLLPGYAYILKDTMDEVVDEQKNPPSKLTAPVGNAA